MHPDAVAGIAYLETIVMPFTWGGFGEVAELFRAWRSPAGEELVLQENRFVEGLVPNAFMRTLDDEEWAEYLRPWSNPGEDRRPTLTWPRQIPIDGEPKDVHATIEAIAQFLPATPIPKLFIDVEPGLAMTDRERGFARTFPTRPRRRSGACTSRRRTRRRRSATRSPSSSTGCERRAVLHCRRPRNPSASTVADVRMGRSHVAPTRTRR
jgi:hypothetical protein